MDVGGEGGVPGYLGIKGERKGFSWHPILLLKQIILRVNNIEGDFYFLL